MQRKLSATAIRDDSAGLSDFLNWGSLIADGVVMCKDGSFLAGWRVTGPDTVSASATERLALAQRVSDALTSLGSGWTMFFDACRVRSESYIPAHLNHFPDKTTEMVEEERREQFEGGMQLLESTHILILQYTPPRAVVSKSATLFFDDATNKRKGPQAIASMLLNEFEQRLAYIEVSLTGALFFERLRDYKSEHGFLRSDIVNFLDFTVSGRQREANILPDGAYLDGVFALDYLDTEVPPKLGDDFIGVVTIDGFPPMSHPSILSKLDELSFEYRWSTRMIFLDRQEAINSIRKYEVKWSQQIRGIVAGILRIEGGRINRDAVDMVEQTAGAEHAASSNLVVFGYYTSCIVVRSKSETDLNRKTEAVAAKILPLGFNARVETWNTNEAFFGTLPGHPAFNVRQPLLHSRNLADFLPLSTLWQGPRYNPCPMYPESSPPLMHVVTRGNTPFRLSLHVSDVANSLIFGPSGKGKTTLLRMLAMQEMRYPAMRLWAFDYKRGLYATAKACGWQYYDIGSANGLSFCPLGMLEADSDTAFAEEWISVCFRLQTKRDPSPKQREDIHHAIALMRGSARRSLSDFVATVKDTTHEIQDALRYYTVLGTAGQLLDSETDTLTSDCNAVFECEEFVLSYPAEIYIPVFLHLFRKFERGLDGRPAVLIIDEAHSLYGNDLFAERLAIWLRTVRSKNAHIVMATQGTKEAIDNKRLSNLLASNCPTKIFLANSKAADRGTTEYPGEYDYYKMLGLTDVDIETIRTATEKQDYYLVQEANRRLFRLELGPKALALCSAGSHEEIARVKFLYERYGDDWVQAWLRERGAL